MEIGISYTHVRKLESMKIEITEEQANEYLELLFAKFMVLYKLQNVAENKDRVDWKMGMIQKNYNQVNFQLGLEQKQLPKMAEQLLAQRKAEDSIAAKN